MTTTLEQWLERIQQCHPRAMDLGLERVGRVAARLGVTTMPAPVITVAGTNGKGSTVALMEALAREQGLSTAAFTSPHLFHFGERMCINGRAAPDADICRAFERVDRARGDDSLTYYEFATLAALCLFSEAGPDLVLLEVGLGGRLDAVNLVDADVAVITSVGLDHTDWLGDTRELIAAEKAGILRPGRPLVYGEEDMPGIVERLCSEAASPLYRAGRDFGVGETGVFLGRSRCAPAADTLLGSDNLATALQALWLAGISPGREAIGRARETRLAGRCEHRPVRGVDWYLDVGHNREALERFLRRAPAAPGRTLAVCAMLSGKPVAALEPFVPRVAHWYLAGLVGPRASGPARLADALPAGTDHSCHDHVAAAVMEAAVEARPGDRVLVFGSFHTVVEAVTTLEDQAAWKIGQNSD